MTTKNIYEIDTENEIDLEAQYTTIGMEIN